MLLETKQLTKRFRNPGKGPGGVLAVSQANMTLNPGETVGLFGDSGSGKSTLGLMLAGLLRPTSGEILYRGEPVRMPYRGACRRNVQVLFQHPEVSFNPMLPLIRSMEEPYRVHKLPYSPEILHRTLPALVSGRSTCSDFRRSSAEESCNGQPWPGCWYCPRRYWCWTSPPVCWM